MSKFCLFVGDLSSVTNEQDLILIFSHVGEVKDARIKRDQNTQRSLMYGFVEFTSVKDAVEAIRLKNGYVHNGRKLRVSWASRKSSPSSTSFHHSHLPPAIAQLDERQPLVSSLLISYNRVSGSQELSDGWLKSVFEQFGPVLFVSIRHRLAQAGFGLVQYVEDELGYSGALAASQFMSNRIFHGVLINAEMNDNHNRSPGYHLSIDELIQPSHTNSGESHFNLQRQLNLNRQGMNLNLNRGINTQGNRNPHIGMNYHGGKNLNHDMNLNRQVMNLNRGLNTQEDRNPYNGMNYHGVRNIFDDKIFNQGLNLNHGMSLNCGINDHMERNTGTIFLDRNHQIRMDSHDGNYHHHGSYRNQEMNLDRAQNENGMNFDGRMDLHRGLNLNPRDMNLNQGKNLNDEASFVMNLPTTYGRFKK